MTTMPLSKGELVRVVGVRLVAAIVLLAAIFFLPAGTLGYWQAWVWMAVLFTPMLWVLFWMLKNDPALLERRMRTREKEQEQGTLMRFTWVWFLLTFIVPGLDSRFGWSDVPVWLVILGDVLLFVGYLLFIAVMRANTYASRVVEVEEGQTVISSGPYALVRHPMYLAAVIMFAFTPLALGSYWALIPALAIVPVLVLRILNEEKVLRRELPGYGEYVEKTRYRMVPGIW
jgi:protein-S-isoprenylcysteine O-methyltransferase Ste14